MRGRDVCKAHSGDANVGRPTGLNEDVQHKIVAALRTGNFIEPACRFAGVSETSYYAWRERGEADLEAGTASPFAEFAEATTRAIAEGEMLAVAQLSTNVRNGDQRAIEFYLERRHGARWARKDWMSLDHSGRIQTETVEVPDEAERRDEVARILGQVGAMPDGEAS